MAKNILIIDDERSIRNAMKEILEYEKYSVTTAENGKEGLHYIAKKDFDLVFCDIKMPELDGIDVLKKIIEEKPETPVIMISGRKY